MPLLASGMLPRRGQRCIIDGQPAIHTGKGEYHLVDERGETVMKEGRTFTLVTRARMNEILALAATLDGGVDAHVSQAADPADSWISGTIAATLHTSGILMHVLGSGAEIELVEPDWGSLGIAERFGGAAEAEGPQAP